jgi:hypothetical protein
MDQDKYLARIESIHRPVFLEPYFLNKEEVVTNLLFRPIDIRTPLLQTLKNL